MLQILLNALRSMNSLHVAGVVAGALILYNTVSKASCKKRNTQLECG